MGAARPRSYNLDACQGAPSQRGPAASSTDPLMSGVSRTWQRVAFRGHFRAETLRPAVGLLLDGETPGCGSFYLAMNGRWLPVGRCSHLPHGGPHISLTWRSAEPYNDPFSYNLRWSRPPLLAPERHCLGRSDRQSRHVNRSVGLDPSVPRQSHRHQAGGQRDGGRYSACATC